MGRWMSWVTLALVLYAMMVGRSIIATASTDPWNRVNAVPRIVVIIVGAALIVVLALLLSSLAHAAIALVMNGGT